MHLQEEVSHEALHTSSKVKKTDPPSPTDRISDLMNTEDLIRGSVERVLGQKKRIEYSGAIIAK